MIIDAREATDLTTIDVDLCIVGAGAAGISIAVQFLDSPLKVCLLEAGGFDLETDTQALQSGENVGLPYHDLAYSHLRYFGGTTNHWSGWSRPYDSIDFKRRDYIAGSGWPITRAELEPYYLRAQKICDLDDESFDLQSNTERLNAFFHDLHPGDGLETRMWHRSPPTRFGPKYKEELTKAENIQVILNANLTEIKIDAAGSSVTSLHALTLNQRSIEVKANRVILSMGGIETPRLLLASKVGNQNDQVGRYFMLHPQVKVGQLVGFESDVRAISKVKPGRGMVDIRAGISLSEEKQEIEKLPNHALLFSPQRLTRLEKLTDQFSQPDDLIAVGQLLKGVSSDTENATEFGTMNIELRMEHLPNTNSRLKLSDNLDALGVPQPVLDWHTNEQDFEGVKKTVELVANELSALGIGRIKTEDWMYSSDKQLPETSEWDYHHIGGTRMSADPTQGVVDRNCKVHGVNNLYIASSSVFTTSGFSNPTLTIVALGLRLADHLKKEMNA